MKIAVSFALLVCLLVVGGVIFLLNQMPADGECRYDKEGGGMYTTYDAKEAVWRYIFYGGAVETRIEPYYDKDGNLQVKAGRTESGDHPTRPDEVNEKYLKTVKIESARRARDGNYCVTIDTDGGGFAVGSVWTPELYDAVQRAQAR